MVLTGRLCALALLGVLAAIASAPAAAVFAAALLALVVIDLTWAGRIADLTLDRDPPAAVRLGERGATRLWLANRGRRTVRARFRDAWVPSAGLTPRFQVLRVGPGERRAVSSTLRPTRRGERRAVFVAVRSYGPLGLAARQRRVGVPGVLRVLPAFTSRRFLPEKLARLRQIEGATLVHQRGQGSEFDSLRSYVLGDDVRSIDWRASARSRDVVVRTWRPERDRQLILAIDTGRSSAARIGDEPRLDAALDAALLLGALAARAGDRVALVAADVDVRARLGLTAGRDLLPRLVTALTPLEPALVETDPLRLVTEISRQTSKRALIVVFSALDTAADTGLLPVVRALVARHEVVVASVADPTLGELARGRDDAGAVYVAAVAELAQAGRGLVTDRLERLGATVVDAVPGAFAGRVADAYLDLKAAGRL